MITPTPSSARVAANQENAQKSTGPKTPEGKQKSSQNAVTTALTGRTVLLASDSAAVYEAHLQSYVRQFQPVTDYEQGLVQSLADTDWRLQRIPHLIFALEVRGFSEFADAFQDLDESRRGTRIEIETRLKYEKQFRNLELQESRLQRRRDKAILEIQAVIQEREAHLRKQLEVASQLAQLADKEGQSFHPADHGFEFSPEVLDDYMQQKRAALLARQAAALSIVQAPHGPTIVRR